MHIHILGICGTFMGGVAQLAKSLGHKVTGSDANVYPPMSTQLAAAGIDIYTGYDPAHLDPIPDQVVVGNAMTRGNPAIEYILNNKLHYTSGPQWLAENLLHDRWVLATAGTHGKTTTSAMLAWILEHAGLNPGFLIGGVPVNFGVSAKLGAGKFFVVEADEYDTAFFDKRSKFIHYRPNTLIMNNLEMDHADIFDDLAQIQKQFHHLIRTIPSSGNIIFPIDDRALQQVLKMGCWTPNQTFSIHTNIANWAMADVSQDESSFTILYNTQPVAHVNWNLTGQHNIANALAAIAAAFHAGVSPELAASALNNFHNVKRRMELRGQINNIAVYDDFAHHPTAIYTTLEGLRARVGDEQRILAVLEPRSNTMRLGVHSEQLVAALQPADLIYMYAPPGLSWDVAATLTELGDRIIIKTQVSDIIVDIVKTARSHDNILIMSNGGFENIHQRLLDALQNNQ
jgi:UDP-N-acetylmuramate: L-alanyl-gamma-D-glutamyl-meso-diaminopimelate ligase